MITKVITATRAVSEAVKLAKPKVIPVYPITPITTVSEYLAEMVANEEIDAKYVKVESEHSAMSAAIGASGAGVRVFTATSSQGLMLMHEVLFAAAGMRMPIVMADANRAISAPLNIWNDQQDSISQRDAGWIQIYVEDGQEALDTTLMAYKISENENVLLPTMICLDGFILTHTVEPTTIPDQEDVDKFLPPYNPKYAYLRPEDPMSIGTFADPEYYMEARHDIQVALDNSIDVIHKTQEEFKEIFGREYGLVEPYQCEDADIIFIAMGSICSTIRLQVDALRSKGEKVGLLKIRTFRPFPVEEIKKAVANASKLAVVDKNVSFGIGGVLYSDISTKINGKETYSFITGLGGRDITPETIDEIYEKTINPVAEVNWIGLKEE